MTRIEAVRRLFAAGPDLGFIGNYLYTAGGPDNTRTLLAVVVLLDATHAIASISGTPPSEQLLINGYPNTAQEVQAMADAITTSNKTRRRVGTSEVAEALRKGIAAIDVMNAHDDVVRELNRAGLAMDAALAVTEMTRVLEQLEGTVRKAG